MAKKITIDDLALMIGKGFNGVDERLGKIDERFDNLEKRFEKRFDKIDAKLNNIVYRNDFEKLENRVKEIENILAGAGIKV